MKRYFWVETVATSFYEASEILSFALIKIPNEIDANNQEKEKRTQNSYTIYIFFQNIDLIWIEFAVKFKNLITCFYFEKEYFFPFVSILSLKNQKTKLERDTLLRNGLIGENFC